MKNGPAFEWVKMRMRRVFSGLSAVLCYYQVLHVVCFCLVQSTTMECMTWHELHYWHDCIVGIQTIALYFLYLFSCFSLQRFKLVIDPWIPPQLRWLNRWCRYPWMWQWWTQRAVLCLKHLYGFGWFVDYIHHIWWYMIYIYIYMIYMLAYTSI